MKICYVFLKYILPPVYDETGLYAKFSSLSYVFFLRPISIKQTKEFLAEEKEKTNSKSAGLDYDPSDEELINLILNDKI